MLGVIARYVNINLISRNSLSAKIAFKELGQILKLRREYEFHATIHSFLPNQEVNDPATIDDDLQRILSDNKRIHGHKIAEVSLPTIFYF